MRILLANLLPWADFRRTYGQAISTRELIKRRIARQTALIVGSDALVDWSAGLIDQGYRSELECVIAKILGSEALKEATRQPLIPEEPDEMFVILAPVHLRGRDERVCPSSSRW
jgi:alkylation response protein AidB-like acyl-CoA dehydrogenase